MGYPQALLSSGILKNQGGMFYALLLKLTNIFEPKLQDILRSHSKLVKNVIISIKYFVRQ